jgi:hypothetical protein
MIKRRNISPSHRDTFIIQDYQASTIADKVIGIVPCKCELVAVKEVHGTAGDDSGAVSLAIERLQGTETSTGGDSVATEIDLKGTANTVQSGTLTTTAANLVFSAGDRVGIDVTGTTTNLATMHVVCQFRPVD